MSVSSTNDARFIQWGGMKGCLWQIRGDQVSRWEVLVEPTRGRVAPVHLSATCLLWTQQTCGGGGGGEREVEEERGGGRPTRVSHVVSIKTVFVGAQPEGKHHYREVVRQLNATHADVAPVQKMCAKYPQNAWKRKKLYVAYNSI